MFLIKLRQLLKVRVHCNAILVYKAGDFYREGKFLYINMKFFNPVREGEEQKYSLLPLPTKTQLLISLPSFASDQLVY